MSSANSVRKKCMFSDLRHCVVHFRSILFTRSESESESEIARNKRLQTKHKMASMEFTLLFGLSVLICGFQASKDASQRKSGRIPCSTGSTRQTDHLVADNIPHVMKDKSWLVLSASDEEHNDLEGVKFILKDSSLNPVRFLKNDADRLICTITLNFTDNIQIIWPSLQNDENTNQWFSAVIRHPDGNFQVTIYMSEVTERASVEEHKLQQHKFLDADTHHVTAVYILSTNTPLIQSTLKKDVLLDCSFSLDHQVDVTVTWLFQGKGRKKIKLLTYNGARKTIQYHSEHVTVHEEDLLNGNASILLRDVALENQGVYTCSVSAAGLYGDQNVHLEIWESPVVSLNVESLLLEEGQEEKILCSASHYYPLDVNIEWLQEDQDKLLVPSIVQNTFFSGHIYNSDGTYSLIGFFMFRASLQDNGITFTCRVEHPSLASPIRRRVQITVIESKRWRLEEWLILTVVILSLILFVTFVHIWRGRLSNKEACVKSTTLTLCSTSGSYRLFQVVGKLRAGINFH
ncbi:tapasin-related protein-like [Spea bombifrons]|uniref:tapasin-related protein-like n=1 Tax=Spea bombifrons TaxID=233779 RepID=UPI00234AB36C|nr:tapasin-related protein-like [Spea bombifrons]